MMDALAYADLQDTGNAQSQLLLLAIARCVDWESGQGFPGIDRLATMGKCSRRTAQYHIRRLVDLGFIRIDARIEKSGRRTSNLYTLVGYADWLKTVRRGGVVAAPKVVEREENDAAPTVQNLHGPVQDLHGEGADSLHGDRADSLHGGPCKQVAPYHKNYLSKDHKNYPDRAARENDEIDLGKGKGPKPHRPALTITRSDTSWSAWLGWLTERDQSLARRAIHWGELVADRRWPDRGETLPKIRQLPANVTGDAT
jgi:hypothetical protein